MIVHELLHLSVPNHGRIWKALMRAHLGDWEASAERLRQAASPLPGAGGRGGAAGRRQAKGCRDRVAGGLN